MSKKIQNQEEFIMKPKVDFCFKELMEDAEVLGEKYWDEK